jgi:hypothetical protein
MIELDVRTVRRPRGGIAPRTDRANSTLITVKVHQDSSSIPNPFPARIDALANTRCEISIAPFEPQVHPPAAANFLTPRFHSRAHALAPKPTRRSTDTRRCGSGVEEEEVERYRREAALACN